MPLHSRLLIAISMTLLLSFTVNARELSEACVAPAMYYNNADEWDWAASGQLPGSCTVARGCAGGYVQPPRHWPQSNLAPQHAAWRGEAVTVNTLDGQVLMTGDVSLTKGYLSIEADNVTLDRDTDELQLDGSVVLRQPNLLVRGERAQIDTNTELGTIDAMRFVMHDRNARGTARFGERARKTLWDLDDVSYTHCPPDKESWRLTSKNLKLNEETGVGVARQARLYLGEVPVLYTPYISFPLDDRRKSGFLAPLFGSSRRSGVEVTLPYYWNIAPNTDATLAPRYFDKRGAMLEAEVRHLSPYTRANAVTLAGGYLPDDAETGENRWLANVLQKGRYGNFWSSYIDYTQVSDDNYFRDLDTASLEVQRNAQLEQAAGLGYRDDIWRGQLDVIQYQTIDENLNDPYKRLPQLTIQNHGGSSNFAPDWLLLTQWTSFDHIDPQENDTGQRLYAETGASFPMYWPAGFIIPTAKVKHVNYSIDTVDPDNPSHPATTVPTGSLDMGLFFERDVRWQQKAFLQTLEPRLYYLYSQYKNQDDQPDFDTGLRTFSYYQLFRDTRFSGYDRLDDANQLSIAVTSRFIEDSSGRDVLTMQIGQIVYFEDRKVQVNPAKPAPGSNDKTSAIAAGLDYRPSNYLTFSSSLLWDTQENVVDEGGFSLNWSLPGKLVYNLGYRYRRDGENFSGTEPQNISQIDTSLALPIEKNWTLFGRYQYDLQKNTH